MLNKFYFDSIIGKTHEENQDAIACIFNDQDIFIGCVCDGIGSTIGAQKASSSFIKILQKEANTLAKTDLNINRVKKWFIYLIKKVNEEYFKIISNNHSFLKMSTTICLCVYYNKKMFWINIGDSRLYVYKHKTKNIELITTDQTLKNYLINNNLEIKDEHKLFLESLTNSFFYKKQIELQKFDIGEIDINKKDKIIISSDGAYKFCNFNNINFENNNLEELVEIIIKNSIENKSHDDISVGIFNVE